MTPYEALDWDIRQRVPAFLRAASLDDHADAMAALAPVTSLERMGAARDVCRAAALAAHARWGKRKPPAGSTACRAARTAAIEASKMTLLPSANIALPVACELASAPADIRNLVTITQGDAEGSVDWSAAVVACGNFECPDHEMWLRARGRLADVVRAVLVSWPG